MGCCPFTFLHRGTICLEVKTGAPYLKFRPIIRQQLGYGAPARVRRPGGTGGQPVHYGSWPWGGKSSLAALHGDVGLVFIVIVHLLVGGNSV